MTLDEKRLLKHGLFGAFVIAGFWLLISAAQRGLVTVVGMIVWSAFLYLVFYRDARQKDPD
ncbi:MAG TPA: hypothetical protein VKH63_18805 [Candidatus Acidoferrum sp.]|nr:hypothetical protein [Candidatus Acidoferrum sp.]